jgi:hypothetical protein
MFDVITAGIAITVVFYDVIIDQAVRFYLPKYIKLLYQPNRISGSCSFL